jgi:DNA-binding MarR family transcriptional regulator
MKRKVATKSRSGPKRRRTGKKHDSHSADLRALARQTELQLSVIQRRMRQRLQAEFARGNLTGPQRLVMSVLVRHQGLSLKQLSQAVSLAHSTVSGIVDRLVKQGLIERQPHSTDRRVTLLTASDPVRKFMKTRMPELALHPLLDALRLGSPAELHAITKGLDTLAQLFSRTTTTPASEEEILDF